MILKKSSKDDDTDDLDVDESLEDDEDEDEKMIRKSLKMYLILKELM